MEKPRVILIIEGGVLQNVLSNQEIEYMVVDYDVEGTDETDLFKIDQGEGCTELANCYTSEAGGDHEAVGSLFKQFDSQVIE